MKHRSGSASADVKGSGCGRSMQATKDLLNRAELHITDVWTVLNFVDSYLNWHEAEIDRLTKRLHSAVTEIDRLTSVVADLDARVKLLEEPQLFVQVP